MAVNQHVNKVIFNGTTLMDLSSDTVTPETLLSGTTAHDASGQLITGTMSGGGSSNPKIYITPVDESDSTGLSGSTITVTTDDNTPILTQGVENNNAFSLDLPYNTVYKVTYPYKSGSTVTETVDLSKTNSVEIKPIRCTDFSSCSEPQLRNILDKYYNETIEKADLQAIFPLGSTRDINLSAVTLTDLWDYQYLHSDYVDYNNSGSLSQPQHQNSMQIVDYEKDELETSINNRTKAGISLRLKYALPKSMYMSGYYQISTGLLGYYSTYLRKIIDYAYLYAAFPKSILYLLKPCLKNDMTNANYASTSTPGTQKCNIWLPSYNELFGGTGYQYYVDGGAANRKTTTSSDLSTYVQYWTRSLSSASSSWSSSASTTYYICTSNGSSSSANGMYANSDLPPSYYTHKYVVLHFAM